jgi:tetratricopeptide (TPR) repeat protein
VSQGSTPVSDVGGGPAGPLLHELVRQGRSFSGHERNSCFLNLGQGKFADISSASGWDFPDDGRGIAQVDWDLDGDLDVWLANRNGPQLRFLRNDVPDDHHFVQLRLEGKTCNRDAIGARIEVRLDGETQPRIRTLRAGEGFLSQSSKTLHFGLGNASSPPRVVVHWPGGTAESFSGVEPDGRYRLVQGTGRAEPWGTAPRAQPLHPAILVEPKGTERLRVLSASQLPLPRLEYTTFDGAPRIVGEGTRRGPVLLHLWSRGCATCLQELQTWKREAEAFRSAGIDVISLSVDGLTAAASLDPTQAATNASDSKLQAERDAIRETVERLAIPYTSGMATPATAETIRLVLEHLFDLHTPLTVPLSILISPQGTLLALYRGNTEIQTITEDAAASAGDHSGHPLAYTPSFAGRWFVRPGSISPFDLEWRLVERGRLDDALKYLERNRDSLSQHFQFHKLLVLVGNAHLARGEADKAAMLYREALKINVEYADAQNNLAWLLATHPDDRLWNGSEAVKLAETAVRNQGENPSLLDTLAAAYAADGNFEAAIRTARNALEMARAQNQTLLASKLEQRLTLYQSGRPYRSK